MQQKIEGLVVEHGVGDRRLLLEGEDRGQNDSADARPAVRHPLVMTHPVTGETAISTPSGSARGIVGMDDEEGIALLIAVKRHMIQPQFCTSAAARSNTVVIWDNYAVMHSATPTKYSDADGERRMIYRISTRDIPVLPGLNASRLAEA